MISECQLHIISDLSCRRWQTIVQHVLVVEIEIDLDDPICLCFHVSKRKVLSFIRVEKPSRASQLSECQGAGTGCGWCRSYLNRLLEAANESGDLTSAVDLEAEEYAAGRAKHIRETGSQPPPGATPLEP